MSSLHNWESALACHCIIFWVRQQWWLYKTWDLLNTGGELIQRPNLEELQNKKNSA
jgi:hypothetical protein